MVAGGAGVTGVRSLAAMEGRRGRQSESLSVDWLERWGPEGLNSPGIQTPSFSGNMIAGLNSPGFKQFLFGKYDNWFEFPGIQTPSFSGNMIAGLNSPGFKPLPFREI